MSESDEDKKEEGVVVKSPFPKIIDTFDCADDSSAPFGVSTFLFSCVEPWALLLTELFPVLPGVPLMHDIRNSMEMQRTIT